MLLPRSADTSATAGRPPQRTAAEPPARVLPRDMHGLTAINALGSHLDAVAAQNDLSAVA